MLTHPFLTKLGVPTIVQQFFIESFNTDKIGNLIFRYGMNDFEHFGFAFHLVPTTDEVWFCGRLNCIKKVFICISAMDAISFLSLNHYKFKNLEQLLFVSIGNKLSTTHINWMKANIASKNFAFIFSRDVLGRILDVKMALALLNKSAKFHVVEEVVYVEFNGRIFSFDQVSFSLFMFCKVFGFRTDYRTYKSKTHSSFFEQLKSGQ